MWAEAAVVAQESPTAGKAAIIGMITTLGGAVIYGVFSLLQARFGKKESSPRAMARLNKEHDAMERFLLLHGYDPRKIKTGYESDDEAKHGTS